MSKPETKRIWYSQRRARGICIDCSSKTDKNYAYCFKCRLKRNVK